MTMEKCVSCSEAEATTQIANPNTEGALSNPHTWKVCEECKKNIKSQQDLSFGYQIKELDKSKFSQEYGDNLIAKAKKELGFL